MGGGMSARPALRLIEHEDRGFSSPCWIWQKARRSDGYGALRHNGRCARAHVVFYERVHGPVPGGLVLDHLCRVRACVNPDLLEPVTLTENIRRGARTKLNEAQVREIRALLASGMSQREAGLVFGVHKATISAIASRRSWRDVA